MIGSNNVLQLYKAAIVPLLTSRSLLPWGAAWRWGGRIGADGSRGAILWSLDISAVDAVARSCSRTSFPATTSALESMGQIGGQAMENCIGDVEELLGSSVFRRVLRRLIVPPGHQQRKRPWRQDTLSTYPRPLQIINTDHTALDHYIKHLHHSSMKC